MVQKHSQIINPKHEVTPLILSKLSKLIFLRLSYFERHYVKGLIAIILSIPAVKRPNSESNGSMNRDKS